MNFEISWKYSFSQSFRKQISYNSVIVIVSYQRHKKFETLQRIQSIPTLSRVLFYRGIDESRDRFTHFMESEPRGKVGSFFDITRIIWFIKLVRIIMIKLLLNVCTGLHSNCIYFCQNIYLHVISTNFETRLPRYSLCIFWRG